jgi:hypothetical protein
MLKVQVITADSESFFESAFDSAIESLERVGKIKDIVYAFHECDSRKAGNIALIQSVLYRVHRV